MFFPLFQLRVSSNILLSSWSTCCISFCSFFSLTLYFAFCSSVFSSFLLDMIHHTIFMCVGASEQGVMWWSSSHDKDDDHSSLCSCSCALCMLTWEKKIHIAQWGGYYVTKYARLRPCRKLLLFYCAFFPSSDFRGWK